MHSTGSISQRRTSMIRPASPGSARAGGVSSVETRWLPPRSPRSSNQNALIAVSTRPLSGTGSAMTTSKALSRSDATISRRPSAS
jgi:hypothetical protein